MTEVMAADRTRVKPGSRVYALPRNLQCIPSGALGTVMGVRTGAFDGEPIVHVRWLGSRKVAIFGKGMQVKSIVDIELGVQSMRLHEIAASREFRS